MGTSMFSNFFQLNSNLKKNKKYLNTFFFKPKLNMTYTTGVNTIDIELRLRNLRRKAKMRSHLLIDDDLFLLIKSKEILELALANLRYDSHYNLARDKLTKDLNKNNEELLTSISNSIQKNSFKFKPPKKSGGVKNLPISPIKNLIVQEAMRLILSSIYDPAFLSCSHGFVIQNKNCHTALRYVSSDFQGCS